MSEMGYSDVPAAVVETETDPDEFECPKAHRSSGEHVYCECAAGEREQANCYWYIEYLDPTPR